MRICTFSNYENSMLPNDVIVLRNNEEVQEVFGGRLGGGKDQVVRTSQAKIPDNPSSSLLGSPRVVCTKIEAQVAYGV